MNTDSGLAAEIQKAEARVGADEKAHLRWAVVFTARDLPSLSSGEWEHLRLEFRAFAGHANLGPRDIHRTPLLPPDDVIIDYQKKFQQLLEVLEHPDRSYAVAEFTIKVSVERFGRTGSITASMPRMTALCQYVDGDAADCALYHFVSLLGGRFGAMIERCPECQAWFVADRKNQTYCSSRCQSRVTSRRHRERHTSLRRGKPGRPRKAPTLKRTRKKSLHLSKSRSKQRRAR